VGWSGRFAIETKGLTGDVGDASEFALGLRKEMMDLPEVVRAECDVDEVGEAFERIVDFVGDRRGEAPGGGQFFGTHQRAFGHAAFADVPEDENDTDHFASAVADGRATVVDADFRAIPGDEKGMVGETDDCAETADFIDGVFNGYTCVLVEDGKDLVEGFCFGVRLRPAGELFGDYIHEFDVAVGVAGNDCVADAANCGVQPLLTSVRFLAAQLDLPNLASVGGGQLVEDSARLECKYSCGESDEEDKSDPGILVDFDVRRHVFGSAPDDDTQKLIHLGAQFVHVLLALEHMLLRSGSVERS
jgi:hypothetical protein